MRPRRGVTVGGSTVGGSTAAAVLVAAIVAAPGALADGGLDVRSKSVYVLDSAKTLVRASITITLRNEVPNQGNRFYYFNAFRFPLPDSATNIRATSGGASLAVGSVPYPSTREKIARVAFSRLLYGQSRTLTLTYDLPGAKPRSVDPTRVGPGYATFPVYGPGDPGQMKIDIILPSAMEYTATSDLFKDSTSNGKTTITVTESDPAQDNGFWGAISARDPKVAKGTP